MFVSPISSANSVNVYKAASKRITNTTASTSETVTKDSVSFKAIPGCDFSVVRDPHIKRYVESYVASYDLVPTSRGVLQAQFCNLRDVLNKFPHSDRREFYDVINRDEDISNILERVRKGKDSFSKRVADASRRDAELPILVHNNEVLAGIHNAGTYGSDNGGNWFSVFDFGTEDFQIIFHRPKTPGLPEGFEKISYQAFSKDVDGDLIYTKSPSCEYTFYNRPLASGLKRSFVKGICALDGHTTELREYDMDGNLLNPDYLPRKIKKWLGF